MAGEVFTHTASVLQGVFTAGTATVNLGAAIPTALMQNLSASYMQNITRLYDLASQNGVANVYYVGGRAQGQAQIGRVVGPAVMLGAYYTKFGDVCNAKSNSLTVNLAEADCSAGGGGAGGGADYTLAYCVITQLGFSVQSMDMIINENSAIMFTGLAYNGQ